MTMEDSLSFLARTEKSLGRQLLAEERIFLEWVYDRYCSEKRIKKKALQ